MALTQPCRAKFYTNTASACGQPSSRGGKSQLTAPRSWRLNRTDGAQHFLSSNTEILCAGVMAGGVFPPGVPRSKLKGLLCYALTACYPTTLAGPKPHALLSPAISFSKGREQLDILETSSGEASGCSPPPRDTPLARFIEEEPHLMAMLSASTPGSGGSNMPDTATSSRSHEYYEKTVKELYVYRSV